MQFFLRHSSANPFWTFEYTAVWYKRHFHAAGCDEVSWTFFAVKMKHELWKVVAMSKFGDSSKKNEIWKSILDLSGVVRSHNSLIFGLVQKELKDRSVGQALGYFWIVAHPVSMLLVYVFVFGFVFRSKTSGVNAAPAGDYISFLLAGMLPWLAISESLNRTVTAIAAKSAMVKQVVFPVAVLPIVSVFLALIPQFIMTLGYLVYLFFSEALVWQRLPLLCLAVLIEFVMLCGIGFILSAIGVYVKDLRELVQFFTSFGVYIAPIAYPVEWAPEIVRPLIQLNPFSHIILIFQDSFLSGPIRYYSWLVSIIFCGLSLIIGYTIFRRVRPYFGSAL